MVSLSLPYIVKRPILSRQGNAKWKLCKSDAKPSGIRYDKQNKHQLLHIITSALTVTNLQSKYKNEILSNALEVNAMKEISFLEKIIGKYLKHI